MPPKTPKAPKMPSMKELQDLLAELDAEGGLSIGGEDDSGANLDDLFEDSYFHAILHKTVKEESIQINTSAKEDQPAETKDQEPAAEGSTKVDFKVLSLPKECSWGDDHETMGNRLLVRPGYAAVLAALLACPHPSSPPSSTEQQPQQPSIYMATGSSGIGKSSLVYYLASELFKADHDIIVSDPMFTNGFIQKQYYSCYTPHIERHETLFRAISTSGPSSKPTWLICDDILPIKNTSCHVLITSSDQKAAKDKDLETLRKRKLGQPIQFQIPTWSMDEIKAGLVLSLSLPSSAGSGPTITVEQGKVLTTLFKKYKGNPKKIFAWVKANWVAPSVQAPVDGSLKSKLKKSKKTA